MLLQRFGSLDAQQGHQEHRHQAGAQAVEGGGQRAVDVAGALEHAGLEQRGDGKKYPAARDGGLRAKQRRRVLQHTQVRHQSINPSVGRIVIEGNRRVVLGAKSGQVWSALCFGQRLGGSWRRGRGFLQRQAFLIGLRIRPACAVKPLSHCPLVNPESARNLAVGMTIAFEPFYALGKRNARAALRVTASLAQGGKTAVLEARLLPAHRAGGTPEGSRDIVLVGPALLNQSNPRMRLGEAVADGVLHQDNARDDHHAVPILRAHQASVVDDLHAVRGIGNGEQIGLAIGVGHRTPLYRRSKKRTVLVRTPCPLQKWALSSENCEKLLRLCQEV